MISSMAEILFKVSKKNQGGGITSIPILEIEAFFLDNKAVMKYYVVINHV